MVSKLISKILDKGEKPKNDFSDFFRNAKISEKKKLFRQVVAEANDDQKELVAKARRLEKKPA